jgi:hypothetical protein
VDNLWITTGWGSNTEMIRLGVERYVMDIVLNMAELLLLLALTWHTYSDEWSLPHNCSDLRGRPNDQSDYSVLILSRPLLSCVTDSLALIAQGIFKILRKPL